MSGTRIHCDTHVVAWLYAERLDMMSADGRSLIDDRDLVVSPMVELELTYLHEIGRLRAPGAVILADLVERLGMKRSDSSFSSVAAAAASLSWTRDPFDRIIAGDASASACQLLTKDQHMLDNFELAVW